MAARLGKSDLARWLQMRQAKLHVILQYLEQAEKDDDK